MKPTATAAKFESPLVSAEALKSALERSAGAGAHAGAHAGAQIVPLDASFDLSDPDAGRRAFARAHLPGAQYADLDRDLSGPKAAPGPGFTGRHPLPSREAFAATVGRWGIGPEQCVVVMDAQGNPYAARLWWLLRWLGHARVWVLDGGIAAWREAGGSLTSEPTPSRPRPAYPYQSRSMPTVDVASLSRVLDQACALDARAPERFRGDVEPLDPVAGHIPGTLNRPFTDNLDPASKRFKARAELAREFAALQGRRTAAKTIHLCGSGVTACHNLLAMEVAGLPGTALYPGSWSEWCADPARPVARGA